MLNNNIILFLKREGNIRIWYNIFFISIIVGISNAALISIVNISIESIDSETLNYRYFLIFIIVFLIFIITKRYVILKTSIEIEYITKSIRKRISRKIKESELNTIKTMEVTGIFKRLLKDTNNIAQLANLLISAFQSAILILSTLIYIFFISKLIFSIISLFLIIIIVHYSSYKKDIIASIVNSGKLETSFLKSLNIIIDAFIEFKMNSKKSNDFYFKNNILLDNLSLLKIKVIEKLTFNAIFIEIVLYITLISIVFIIPHFGLADKSAIIESTIAFVFILGALENTINSLPLVIKTERSIDKIFDLDNILNNKIYKQNIFNKNIMNNFKNFTKIEFKDIGFYHFNKKTKIKELILKNISFKLTKGDVIFITGKNGSGKSTLIKIITGLYIKTNGTISIDNYFIDYSNLQMYRDNFNLIVDEFYIFDSLYWIEDKDINHKLLNQLLVDMDLYNKTKYINGKFTNLNLSIAEKKRLSLIISILEDKDIYIFDEWAIEQDDKFKLYFYKNIIPKLKEKNKTIIIVTQDNHYFYLADQIFELRDGELILSQINNKKDFNI